MRPGVAVQPRGLRELTFQFEALPLELLAPTFVGPTVRGFMLGSTDHRRGIAGSVDVLEDSPCWFRISPSAAKSASDKIPPRVPRD